MKRKFIFISHRSNDTPEARGVRAMDEGFNFFVWNGRVYFIKGALAPIDTGITMDDVD